MDLESLIRDTARELAGLYEALEERKYSPEKPPEVRTMQNTGGKPSMPGNWLWMSRGVENEQEIRAWAFAAFRDLQIKLKDDEARIQPLLEKISLNAFYIAEWWQAPNFHNILEHQARQMGKWLNPTADSPAVREAARHATQRFSAAEVATLASAATGVKIDRKQVTYWGRSATKPVDVEIGSDGIATYCLAQVIDVAKTYRDERKKYG